MINNMSIESRIFQGNLTKKIQETKRYQENKEKRKRLMKRMMEKKQMQEQSNLQRSSLLGKLSLFMDDEEGPGEEDGDSSMSQLNQSTKELKSPEKRKSTCEFNQSGHKVKFLGLEEKKQSSPPKRESQAMVL